VVAPIANPVRLQILLVRRHAVVVPLFPPRIPQLGNRSEVLGVRAVPRLVGELELFGAGGVDQGVLLARRDAGAGGRAGAEDGGEKVAGGEGGREGDEVEGE
jgi:hypothetical protein